MGKCLGVSKNVFLTSEHVFKLSWRRNTVQYSEGTMWRSGVLHVVLSVCNSIFADRGFKETMPQSHFQKSKTGSEVRNRLFETLKHFSIPKIQF